MTELERAPAPWVERLDMANRLLAEVADDPFRASRVWDFAEAARVYAIQMGLSVEAVNHAVTIKLRAQLLLADAVDKGQAEGRIATRGRPAVNRGASPIIQTISEIGVDPSKLKEARKIRNAFTAEEIELAAADASLAGRELSSAEMLGIAAKRAGIAREHTPAAPDASIPDSDDGRVALLHGDFRERLLELEAGSVDLIITDPPYPKEDLPLYSDLGAIAAKLLGPRGILFVWTGQIFLPEVIDRLREELTYGWTFCLQMTSGGGSRIFGRHIIQAWKPVLAFTTGTWPSGEWGDDLLVSPVAEKDHYEWQQTTAPARRLIERYSAPNGLVVDPFLGVGSFGVAAVAAGRRFVGVELDAGRYATARDRIEAAR